ncbi:SufD family Fe-S cluster assembly protein [Ponticoccus sp. SC2-23]|uniref:SufB/SufD family protein n=1 Tax=Alexandriicola marinus TaxID=2081710 RepID=UPI000FD7A85A|nr:SufD family Fe-S cluster assembly protein [Alexandriicola marinus]MBM1219039.1 SufD family Fe-S cluster assembly protein [Ponticoccus sp. SC6-9]MBM1223889.1 SufD family Fe-S cluster assembly protein [Ponticoccus sp. SC6-15]MBM1228853.1 SufD family Fe-S cluster assembly protein [Ponticoccus sp. SC6-38]MBM1232855.1 SufD family Fe-S cluster assembly protein [Ponticoccus sp. SC6-45]MBM1237195.1 SufD family Fe-S cluster assembly protein [Ponticoccus sp. SC6-49]MBM1241866.1 SufD family Fe-S clus
MSRAALARQKIEAAEARLDGLILPDGATWATEARRAAEARVRAAGLPQRRDEYWRFTNPAPLLSDEVVPSSTDLPEESPVFGEVDRLRIVFVDGIFDPAQSDALEMAGLEIETLAEATATDIHWAKSVFGVLEEAGQKPVDRSLAALNTASAEEGIVIRATAKAEKPVALVYLQSAPASEAMIHHVIRVEEGAELTLLETGPAAARFSKVMEVDVADRGTFHHVRAQGRAHERLAHTHAFARLGTESVYKSFTLTANGRLTRNEHVVELTGDDAVAHIAGACVGDGSDFLHDDTVFITHDAVNCESRQVFKKVLRNGATGVFQGKILVKEGAQKTDGYQISQSLLLDDDSQFLAKPELEIYADDVACSHGSTSGAIDDEALFYLRSRGVAHEDATDLLTLAFLAEALDEIEDERLADDLRDRLENWLKRRK